MPKRFFFTLFLITFIWGTLMTSPAIAQIADDSCDEAVMKERRKYDPDGDGKIGLEVAIHALQVLVGVRTDKDGDSYTEEQGDCDDNNPAVYPGATEIANDGIDQDCDGKDSTDINVTTWYKDADGDKYSDGTKQESATQPDKYFKASDLTAISGDCNDDKADIYPGATEICGDGIDQDCDDKDSICDEDTVENYAKNYETSMNGNNATLFMERVSKECLHNGQDYSFYSQTIQWEFANYTYENTTYTIGQVTYEEKDGKKFAKFTATISYTQVLYGIIETKQSVEAVTLVFEDSKWKFYGNQLGYSSPVVSEMVTCEDVDVMTMKPIGVKNVFTNLDEFVTIFISLDNVADNSVFNVRFYKPDGSLADDEMTYSAVNPWFGYYSIPNVPVPGFEYINIGTWRIELYMDGVGVLSQKTFEYTMVK